VITTRSPGLPAASPEPVPARADAAGSAAPAGSGPTAFRTGAVTAAAHRHHPPEGPLRVLVGKERFSENHAWSERAVALLLALARRLLEAPKGFEPGRWGEPAGRSLSGTAACIVGAGAIGTQIAGRLAAFDVTVTGVRRHPPDGPVPPFAAVYAADRLLDSVAGADSVIISASHRAGQPALVDDTVLRAMRPGAWLVNIARGAVLDADAAIAHLNTGHLAGIGLDVFPAEPCPADGPLVAHPRIVATAHTAALISDYFAAASRRLGDALAGYLDHQPPAGLLR
jgi:phosphoglycerate dehydrogenase-like enzyme